MMTDNSRNQHAYDVIQAKAEFDSKTQQDDLDEYTVAIIYVEIPTGATGEDVDRIFVAVADAAYDAQPAKRDWDIIVHGNSKVGYGR